MSCLVSLVKALRRETSTACSALSWRVKLTRDATLSSRQWAEPLPPSPRTALTSSGPERRSVTMPLKAEANSTSTTFGGGGGGGGGSGGGAMPPDAWWGKGGGGGGGGPT